MRTSSFLPLLLLVLLACDRPGPGAVSEPPVCRATAVNRYVAIAGTRPDRPPLTLDGRPYYLELTGEDTYAYDDQHRLIEHTTRQTGVRNTNTTRYEYLTPTRLKRSVFSSFLNRVYELDTVTLNAQGNIVDARYVYDANGQLLRNDVTGEVFENQGGNVVRISGPNGSVVAFTYDLTQPAPPQQPGFVGKPSRNRLIRSTEQPRQAPGGVAVTTYSYEVDEAGVVKRRIARTPVLFGGTTPGEQIDVTDYVSVCR